MGMEDEIKRLIKVCLSILSILASLWYTYFIASKIPKGKLRFFSLLPIFCLFTILPLSAGVIALFITWVGSFKLLLFFFGLGPLSSGPPLNSLLLFIFTTCLPIKAKQDGQHHHQIAPNHKTPQNPKFPLNLPTKVLLFGILVALTDFTKYLHPNILLGQYCCMLYLFVDIIVGLSNATLRALLGVELKSLSNEPYLSTSLQDFWGRRWNLMVTNTLRHTVHKPVQLAMVNSWGPSGPCCWLFFVAFLVSSLMHELIFFFYMTRVPPTWEVTWYFVLHGMCLVVEFDVKRALSGGKWQLHWIVSMPLTIEFVVVTATWLFFLPLVRNDVDARAIEECKELVVFMKEKLKWDGLHKI